MRRIARLALVALVLGAVPAAADKKPAAPDTAMVQIGSSATATGAFIAYPPGSAAAPGVVVAFEWWGLNMQIRNLARRLAREGGYVVIVPDLYHGKVAGDPEEAHVLMRGLETPVADADCAAAAAYLRGDPRVKGRVGVMGFCMGGGVALDYGIHDSTLAAVVMFYGSPNTDSEQLAKLRAPVLAHFGLKDEGIPQTKIDQFTTAMQQAGRELKVYTYPAAGHAFMNDARPSYQPESARQAWARTLDFLQHQLRR
ncbi:MAG: dienelactone hydrolase family protein [Candidatus Eisenbacteria bacterium]